MGVGVEYPAGELPDALLHLPGDLEGGPSAAVDPSGGVGADVVDGGARVAPDDVDLLQWDLEHLGDYLRVGVLGATAVVHQRRDVVESAVLVHLEHGAAEVDDGAWHRGSRAARVVAPADAPAPSVSARLLLGPGAVVPVDHLGALGEYLLDAAALDDGLDRGPLPPEEVPLADVVLKPEVEGVDAHLFGEFVHEGLHGPGDLGVPVAPEGAAGHLVGVDGLADVALVGELVEADPPADHAAE